jgi:hypothetical protein
VGKIKTSVPGAVLDLFTTVLARQILHAGIQLSQRMEIKITRQDFFFTVTDLYIFQMNNTYTALQILE